MASVQETWACALCEDHPKFEDRSGFFDHCHDTHPNLVGDDGKIDVTGTPTRHLDGPDWFAWEYRWTLPDGRHMADCRVTQERAADDPMRGE